MRSAFLGFISCLFLLNVTLADASSVIPRSPIGSVSGGGGQQSSTAVPAAAASPSAALKIPCIDSNGAVKNVDDPTKICAAILPKCSALKAAWEANTKSYLSKKFWGYYNGKDIDMNSSTATNLVGPAVSAPYCSVVGQKLAASPPIDAEITTQKVVPGVSCGSRPKAVYSKATGVGLDIHFLQEQNIQWGSLWVSYMNGAQLWAMRRAAYDVFDGSQPGNTGPTLAADLSNINLVIQSPDTRAALAQIQTQMSQYISNLTTQSKSACIATDTDIINKCLNGQTDGLSTNSQTLCVIVKALFAANTGGMGNLLTSEVINRATALYGTTVGTIFQPGKNRHYEELKGTCSHYFVSGKPKTKNMKAACSASCMFDGEEEHANAKSRTVDSGVNSWDLTCKVEKGDLPMVGFKNMMDTIIRQDICGQHSPKDVNACDCANIPANPNITPAPTPDPACAKLSGAIQ